MIVNKQVIRVNIVENKILIFVYVSFDKIIAKMCEDLILFISLVVEYYNQTNVQLFTLF